MRSVRLVRAEGVGGPEVLVGDVGRIRQIVTNLVANGITVHDVKGSNGVFVFLTFVG